MNTKPIIFATALLSTPMFLACDEGSSEDELEIGELDSADQAPLRVTVDGEDRPERIVASVEPDPDTKIYFIESGIEGEEAIDVVIVGRDGGLDYGGLIARDKATPLEVYVALAEDEQPIPEALSRDHDRRRGSAEGQDILKPAEASVTIQDVSWENIQSTFTCLNWSNYQAYMATRFSGEADRVETLSSYSEWHEVKAPTDGSSYWDESEADMVVCNKESGSSPYNDTVISAACVISLGIPPVEDCLYVPLDDGHYLRRLYGEVSGWRRYRAAASPTSASQLQTYIGIVANPE